MLGLIVKTRTMTQDGEKLGEEVQCFDFDQPELEATLLAQNRSAPYSGLEVVGVILRSIGPAAGEGEG